MGKILTITEYMSLELDEQDAYHNQNAVIPVDLLEMLIQGTENYATGARLNKGYRSAWEKSVAAARKLELQPATPPPADDAPVCPKCGDSMWEAGEPLVYECPQCHEGTVHTLKPEPGERLAANGDSISDIREFWSSDLAETQERFTRDHVGFLLDNVSRQSAEVERLRQEHDALAAQVAAAREGLALEQQSRALSLLSSCLSYVSKPGGREPMYGNRTGIKVEVGDFLTEVDSTWEKIEEALAALDGEPDA